MNIQMQASKITKTLSALTRRPAYVCVAFFVACVCIVLMILLQSFPFIKSVWSAASFPLSAKIHITTQSLHAFNSNLTHTGQFFHIIISLLIGLDIALFIFYYRSRRKLEGAAGISFVGVLSGILGIGCSACGSVILSSLLGLSLASVLITMLPLRGLEFSIAAVLFLCISIGYLGVKYQDPLVCKTKKK